MIEVSTRRLNVEEKRELVDWITDPNRFSGRYKLKNEEARAQTSMRYPGDVNITFHDEDAHWAIYCKTKWG